MKTTFISVLFSLITCSILSASQFAMIDMDKVYADYWKQQQEIKIIQESELRLKNFANFTQQDVQPLLQEKAQIETDIKLPAVSEEQKKALVARHDEIMSELQKRQSELTIAQMQHQKRYKNFEETISEDVRVVIAKIAKEQGIDYVFSKQALVYSEKDITVPVLEELNKTAPQKEETANES